ncbi:hypothetical protein H257_04091 [Aphanomyces astaci]|uniref:Tc1-like transposase DDE domain-containing protein n=1 Tax=Aphanomyces astaci TaxID=112090 RepID=W4GUC4_APHAT|nr:hypothetical protein H257_04091 [Aphanomyces astaci]ETV83340.1 hypothetical protein H257_04091 [Aphanomyces astaci]|eukprot:XP_009826770.1 hypothetical protein H257_04091 [Aphanomyces astaci]
MAISNHRVSILYDIQRWHSRIDARRTTYSPLGRSISICIRFGKGSLLTLIGTYFQDSPASHSETTEQEWQWLTQATTKIPGHHHSVIIWGETSKPTAPTPSTDLPHNPAQAPCQRPYPSELQPLELVWANVKGHVGRRNTDGTGLADVKEQLEEAFEVLKAGLFKAVAKLQRGNCRSCTNICWQLTAYNPTRSLRRRVAVIMMPKAIVHSS